MEARAVLCNTGDEITKDFYNRDDFSPRERSVRV